MLRADKAIAEGFVHELIATIGHANFQTILGELRRVARYFQDDPGRGAPDREARITALGSRLLVS